MPDFSRRSTMPELMDTEETGYEDFRQCLRHLALVNRLTLAHRPTLDWLERAIARAPGRPFNILDAGSGYGDMLRAIHRWAARHGVERSEEHTSELQSLMRISYAVFCLKKKNNK